MLSIFSCAYWPFVYLLWRKNIIFRSPAHFLIEFFVFLLFSCMNYSYILEIKLLLVASFANVFSHSVGCLFILLKVTFAVLKLLSLIRSNLFVFVFFPLPLETNLRKHWYDLCQRIFWLCSLLGVLQCHVLYLSLSAILSLFLYMV